MVHFDKFISNDLLKMIAEIDEFKGSWKLLSKLSPERLNTLKKIAAIESIGSSTRIEGSKLSDKEVEILLSHLDTHSFRSRDEEEVAGYALVCEEVFSNYEHIPFSENVIKQLHTWLLQYSHKDVSHRGEYKKHPNHIEAFDPNGKSLEILFQTTSPFEIPKKMEELVLWTQEALKNNESHPLLIIGVFLVLFLEIHPFLDGNGRLSRILTTLLLLKAGYLYVPYCSFESIIEGNKEGYYLALRKTQVSLKDSPEFLPWITFFLRSLIKQKTILQQKMNEETLLSLHVSKVSGELIELIQKHGRLSFGEIARLTLTNKNTVKKHLQTLVRNRQITQHGKGKGTWYTL